MRSEDGARPLVSAIIPTRNRAHCLPRAIESILGQEGAGEDFEVETIVVDDGSTDRTAEVIAHYPEVRYIRLSDRRGVSAAMNAGLRASSGRFVSFLGDDDEWLAHKLRRQVPLLLAHPDVGVIYGQSVVRSDGREELHPRVDRAPSGSVFFDMLLDSFCSNHAAILIRREALRKAGEFDERLSTFEDFDLSLRLARHCEFLFAPGAVTVYNLSPRGAWLSAIASGAGGGDASQAIENALRTLPDSEGYQELKRAARAQVALSPVSPLAHLGELPRAQAQLLGTLAKYPFAAQHEWGRRYVRGVAVKRVQNGEPPVAVVRDLLRGVKAAAGPRRVPFWWWIRLLAKLQMRRLRDKP